MENQKKFKQTELDLIHKLKITPLTLREIECWFMGDSIHVIEQESVFITQTHLN